MPVTGFIGAGKMAEAILRGMMESGVLQAKDICIFDIQSTRVQQLVSDYGVRASSSNVELAATCETVILAVKPQDLDVVMQAIAPQVVDRCVISIAAGRKIHGLEASLPGARIIRVMPNLACQVGAGMSVLCAGGLATAADLAHARTLFAASGSVCEAPESQFDMVTAVSGSGPAFWTQLADYQYQQAISAGLAPETARLLVLQTMLGTASVLLTTGQDFQTFMDAVASKGGTTAAGLAVLRTSTAGSILADVLQAAADRSKELGC